MKCTFVDDRGRGCMRKAISRDIPFCDPHAAQLAAEEEGQGEHVVDVLFRQPAVQHLVDRFGGLLDRLGGSLERMMANGGRGPGGPAPGRPQAVEEDPYVVLGLPRGMILTEKVIRKRRQELAKIIHPDPGSGSDEAMARINRAADALLATLKSK